MAQKPEDERRRHKRIKKNFILKFYEKKNPSIKFDVTQLENISRGGMCFISSIPFDPLTEICVDLRTPFLADVVHLEGTVLESIEKAKDMIYQVRLKFNDINEQAESVLDKLEQYSQAGGEES